MQYAYLDVYMYIYICSCTLYNCVLIDMTIFNGLNKDECIIIHTSQESILGRHGEEGKGKRDDNIEYIRDTIK